MISLESFNSQNSTQAMYSSYSEINANESFFHFTEETVTFGVCVCETQKTHRELTLKDEIKTRALRLFG